MLASAPAIPARKRDDAFNSHGVVESEKKEVGERSKKALKERRL